MHRAAQTVIEQERTPQAHASTIHLWLEFAGRICRQLVCDCHLQNQVATSLISIKQIELELVIF
jgi:hypothetical protein